MPDYIPKTDALFDEWFRNFATNVGPIATALGIAPAFVTAVTAAYADWQVKYPAHQTAQAAARSAAEAKDESRDNGKATIRDLAGMLQSHPDMTDAQRALLKLTVPDLEPTPRGKIDGKPFVDLNAVGGGTISVRVRVTTDKTRASIHELADAVECRYTFAPIGEMPPESWENLPNTVVSKKALFDIHCGAKAIGQRFYGYFRWVNESNPANNGDWTNALNVVVS
ncbi:MAG: hypothetical protein AB1599_07660 [Planctomycetota bacterium]